MAIQSTYPDDAATTGDDKYLTLDSSGATKNTPASTLKDYILSPDNITDAMLVHGKIRNRQGGSATNPSASGTTNYATDSESMFIQVGVTGTGTGGETTITFPTAYTEKPIIICSVYGGNAGGDTAVTQNAFARAHSVTTTNFQVRSINDGGGASDQAVAWIAIGK